MILFLDFDGVLHPAAVYLTRRGVELRGPGELFMWVPTLEKLLAECPQIQVVLSTSWARNFGFREAKKRLPESIRDRVIGATWHSGEAKGWPDQIHWDDLSRYQQIERYCRRARLKHWLALDDDDRGWPDDQRHHLLYCDPQTGLSGLDYEAARAALRECGQAQRIEAVRYARATSALENIRQSPENAEQSRRYIAGEITTDQAIEETKARLTSREYPGTA